MDRLIVGNPDCSFLAVCDSLVTDLNSSSLYRKLKDLARQLGVGSDFLISLERRLNFDLVTLHGALYEVLEHWRGRKSSEVTLENLVLALQRLALHQSADLLIEKFTPRMQSLSAQIENPNLFNQLTESASPKNENENLFSSSIQPPNPRIENQPFPNTLIEPSKVTRNGNTRGNESTVRQTVGCFKVLEEANTHPETAQLVEHSPVFIPIKSGSGSINTDSPQTLNVQLETAQPVTQLPVSISVESGTPQTQNEPTLKIVGDGNIRYDPSGSKKLGTGAYNTTVHPGYFGSELAAIKRMYCMSEEDCEDKETEISIWINVNNHDNIAKYFAKLREDDFIFIAMELCDGTLQDWMKNQITKITKWDIASMDVLRQATEGLSHLHSNGVIHRDLKPENILLVRRSERIWVKLADFGISRIVPDDRNTMTQTRVIGTCSWTAPEVLNPEPGARPKMSRETDIFSLGCIIYYVLSGGVHPFGKDSWSRQQNIRDYRRSLNIDDLPNIQTHRMRVIEDMTQKDRKSRPNVQMVLADFF